MGAVLSLLQLSERKFKEVFLLQPSGKVVPVSWEEIQSSAERFYAENLAKQERASNRKMRKTMRPSTALLRKSVAEVVERPNNETMQLIMNFISKGPNDKSNGVIGQRLHSSSGLWLIPVIDIINGPIVFIDDQGKHVDSEIFFEPWVKLLNSDHQIKTRPTSALKKRAINYAVTGRALGGVISKAQRSQNEEKPHLITVVFKMEDSFDKSQFDFQLLTFSNHIAIQNTLADYLWYVVRKKEQQKLITEEAEKKLMERVEAIKQREREAYKSVKFDPVFTGSEKTDKTEDDFLDEAEHFEL